MESLGRLDCFVRHICKVCSALTGLITVAYISLLIYNSQVAFQAIVHDAVASGNMFELLTLFCAPAMTAIRLLVLSVWFFYISTGTRAVKDRLSALTGFAAFIMLATSLISFITEVLIGASSFRGKGALFVLLTNAYDMSSIGLFLVLTVLGLLFKHISAVQKEIDDFI